MKKILFNELLPFESIRGYFFSKKRKVEKINKSKLDDIVEKEKYEKVDKYEKSKQKWTLANCCSR